MAGRNDAERTTRGHPASRLTGEPGQAGAPPANVGLRLAGMLTAAPDAIIAVGPGGRIRIFNPGAEKLFGHRAAEIIGQPLETLIPERFRAMHGEHMSHFRSAPEQSRLMTERSEILGLRADGSEFPAEASLAKLEMDGEAILTVMLHDVTARKAAEAELIAAKEQAERALIQAEKMAAVGTLAAGIGHEINNPLYAILGTAEAIRDGSDLGRCQQHARDIIDRCKHISGIIRNLTNYIRPADRGGLERIDVNAAIAEAVAMARLSLRSDAIDIVERLGAVPAITAGADEVQQVFFNVIRNGMQAMGGAGTLEIASVREADRAVVRISDTGAGIAPGDLTRIFDPFFTTKGPDEGEGIGLFVVRQIVEKYDGTIDYQSGIGEGTVCTVTFPVREPNREAP